MRGASSQTLLKMNHLLVVAFLIIFTPLLYAVGNIVVDDIKVLNDKGFEFEVVQHHSDDQVIHIRFMIPHKFHFDGAMGTKPFQGVSFYEPTDKAARKARLIAAAGTRLFLLAEKKGKKFEGRFSLIKADAKNKYLEFHFNQGSGYPPMIIHMQLSLLVSQLQKTVNEEQK